MVHHRTQARSDCQPVCQNRGSCSRPHTCVCRSGFQGARCEEVTPEQVYIRDGGALRRVKPGTNPFQKDQARRRPAERQAPDSARARSPLTASTKAPLHAALIVLSVLDVVPSRCASAGSCGGILAVGLWWHREGAYYKCVKLKTSHFPLPERQISEALSSN
ncbi:unnamed protein product [Arctogadus glacialis]